ncbi:MAG: hypothetical protein EP343_04270 [Deltaproteobacteria bacterium]|nr:MAG: hypothetical protein EP343_04270 [Deltaproteobacteria bacterium]
MLGQSSRLLPLSRQGPNPFSSLLLLSGLCFVALAGFGPLLGCGEPLPTKLTVCNTNQDCGANRLCITNVCVASGQASTNEPPQDTASSETTSSPDEPPTTEAPSEPNVGDAPAENPVFPERTEGPMDRTEVFVDTTEQLTNSEPSVESVANEQDGGTGEQLPESVVEAPESSSESVPETPSESQPESSPDNVALCTPGQTQVCFGGTPSQINVGTCKAGTQTCDNNKRWGPCLNEVPPSLEVCDGRDNDCNGAVDDNIQFTSPTCQPNPLPQGAYCQTVATQCNNGLLKCESQKVSTLIKTSPGLSEGWLAPCTQALFERPEALAFDPSGNLYFTEFGNHAIRKINLQTGQVTRIAGGLGAGHVDGPPNQAKFNYPLGLAIDTRGRIFVADRYNHVIRLIQWITNGQCGNASGYTGYCVSTIAGKAGDAKSDDGPGLLARFNQPFGLVVNSKDELFVADHSNHRIRKITFVENGTCDKTQNYRGYCVETYAGSKLGFKDGKADKAELHYPTGLAVDPQDNLYVSDRSNHAIRTIDTQQDVKTLAGNGKAGRADDTGKKAQFFNPRGLTLDKSGNIYVADYNNHTIRKITPAGVVTTHTGKAGDASAVNGLLASARFNYPSDIAIGPDGRWYVLDLLNDTIRVFDNIAVRTLAGVRGTNKLVDGKTLCAQIREPIQATRDAQGRIYITDRMNHVIYRILANGYLEIFAGTGTAGFANGHRLGALFNGLIGLEFDKQGNLYVADAGNQIVRMITPSGNVVTLAGIPRQAGFVNNVKRDKAKFNRPNDVTIDSQGNVLIADINNHCIRKLDVQTEMVSRFAGTCSRFGVDDGVPGTGKLNRPAALLFNNQGRLYIAGFGSGLIRAADTTGRLSTVAGSTRGFKDGVGTQAQFWSPRGLTLTSTGDILIADPFNFRIRLLDTLTNTVSTRAGKGVHGLVDDYALLASFDDPFDIIPYNNQGDWLILDGSNSTLRLLPGCR